MLRDVRFFERRPPDEPVRPLRTLLLTLVVVAVVLWLSIRM